MDAKEKQQILFTQLVLMFHAAAIQQMGKLKNPITDKIERDLGAAQGSIDLLDMLKEKTQGNLTPEENRLLGEVLKELKLNYVDELNKPDPAPPADTTAQQQEGKINE
jgi:hypothetical protein